MSKEIKNIEQSGNDTIHNVSGRLSPDNIWLYDELYELQLKYTPEQIRKMWDDVKPKMTDFPKGTVMITGTPNDH